VPWCHAPVRRVLQEPMGLLWGLQRPHCSPQAVAAPECCIGNRESTRCTCTRLH
jgi:hypothetical protein